VNYFYLVSDGTTPTRIYGRSTNAALAGTSVTLSGVGFATILADNLVFIGAQHAVVTAATDTSLTFTVPTQAVSSEVVVVTPKGANLGGQFYDIGTDLQPTTASISSLAVDSVGTKFFSTTGPLSTLADRVFTFDPSTGVRTEVGLLGEATGLPTDEDTMPTNRVYYGNATVSINNGGTINRTRSGGGQTLYRACGTGGTDPCYVWGIGIDPDVTDFGADGRVYVADGCTYNGISCGSTQEVLVVPFAGFIQTFASGFTFGSPPRGIVVDRDSASMFYHPGFLKGHDRCTGAGVTAYG